MRAGRGPHYSEFIVLCSFPKSVQLREDSDFSYLAFVLDSANGGIHTFFRKRHTQGTDRELAFCKESKP
jgi:hypothetical protein